MFSHRLIAALGSATLAVASPALADPREAPPMPTAAASPAADVPSRTEARAVSPNQRYCVVQTATGSRIPRRICDTRAGWMVYGFDPLAAK